MLTPKGQESVDLTVKVDKFPSILAKNLAVVTLLFLVSCRKELEKPEVSPSDFAQRQSKLIEDRRDFSLTEPAKEKNEFEIVALLKKGSYTDALEKTTTTYAFQVATFSMLNTLLSKGGNLADVDTYLLAMMEDQTVTPGVFLDTVYRFVRSGPEMQARALSLGKSLSYAYEAFLAQLDLQKDERLYVLMSALIRSEVEGNYDLLAEAEKSIQHMKPSGKVYVWGDDHQALFLQACKKQFMYKAGAWEVAFGQEGLYPHTYTEQRGNHTKDQYFFGVDDPYLHKVTLMTAFNFEQSDEKDIAQNAFVGAILNWLADDESFREKFLSVNDAGLTPRAKIELATWKKLIGETTDPETLAQAAKELLFASKLKVGEVKPIIRQILLNVLEHPAQPELKELMDQMKKALVTNNHKQIDRLWETIGIERRNTPLWDNIKTMLAMPHLKGKDIVVPVGAAHLPGMYDHYFTQWKELPASVEWSEIGWQHN